MKVLFCFLTALILFAFNLSAQERDTLNNEKIIQLTKIGLESSVLIMKIKNSYTVFDVSTNSLINLSNNKVSSEVINEMIKTVNVVQTAKEDIKNSSDPLAMHAAGIYYFNAAETDMPLKKVDAMPTNYQTSAGGYGGFGGSSTVAIVSGEESKLKITNRQPVFYFYFDESVQRFADWFASTSPNEFAMVKFISKKGKRLFKIGSSSSSYVVSSENSGIPEKLKIPFTYAQISQGIYKITFKEPLEKGEYCFVFETNSRKVFEFGILK